MAEETVVEYIIDHIETDARIQPRLRRQLSEACLAVLEMSKGLSYEDILLPVFAHFAQLETRLGARFPFHESKKACVNMATLNEEDREEVRQFLFRLFEETVD